MRARHLSKTGAVQLTRPSPNRKPLEKPKAGLRGAQIRLESPPWILKFSGWDCDLLGQHVSRRIAEFDRPLQLAPNNPGAKHGKAVSLVGTGHRAEASPLIDEAIRLSPKWGWPHQTAVQTVPEWKEKILRNDYYGKLRDSLRASGVLR